MKLMRQLEAQHKKLWDQLRPPKSELIDAEDCNPELLSGWTDRDISLWDVSDSGSKPTMVEILVALCHRKKEWEKVSYLIFPADTVSNAGLLLTESNGNTGDQRIDLSHTHFEIKNISGRKLCSFLYHVSISEFETGLFTRRDFDEILYEAYNRISTRPVLETSTARTDQENLPSTGTVAEVRTSMLCHEQLSGATSINEQQQIPSSSYEP